MQAETSEWPNVWYARQQRFESASKFIVYDERGRLSAGDGMISFTGAKGPLQIALGDVVAITLVGSRPPWISYLCLNAGLVAWLVLTAGKGAFSPSSLTMILLANIFGFAVAAATKWVAVAYRNAAGVEEMAYFANGSAFGWGGIFGGTARLCEALTRLKAGKRA